MNNLNQTDVCAVELACRIDPCTRTFPCAKGCDMLVTSLVSRARFDNFFAEVINSGFAEITRECDEKHLTVTLQSRRERLYLIYAIATEELRMIWEKRSNRPDFSGTGDAPVEVMQLGIGNYGKHTDNPMVGMGFIVKLQNSHALIVDGGYNTEGCADNIIRALEKLNIATDGDGRFLVDSWYFTHLDGDHVGILHSFSAKYAARISLRSFVQNFPVGDTELINGGYPQIGRDYLNLMATAFPEAAIITAHPSDVLHYAGAKIRIVYTAELFYSPFSRIWDGNDTSLVFMLETAGKRMLFTGDAGEVTARALYYLYAASSLKADVIQFPHHGLTTGYSVFNRPITEHVFLNAIYEAVDPRLAMLPMGETFDDYRWCHGNNQRKWVFENYPKDGYFLDKSRADFGYDGVNIIRKTKADGKTLTTYMMSSDEEPMVNVFRFTEDQIEPSVNETLNNYFNIR